MAGLGLLLATTPVLADTKIISEVTNEGSGTAELAPAPHEVTIYYQGDKARVETDEGAVVIYDFRTMKAYRLNATRKTYDIVAIDAGPDADLRDRLQQAKTSVKMTVTPSEQHKTLAGVEAQKVTLTGKAQTEVEQGNELNKTYTVGGGGGSMAGGFPMIGGAIQAANREQREQAEEAATDPNAPIDIDGEFWLSDQVHVVDRPANELFLLPLYAQTVPADRITTYVLRSMMLKLMGNGNAVPVSSRVTVSRETASANQDVVLSRIREINNGPLDRSLFIVPAEYRQAGF